MLGLTEGRDYLKPRMEYFPMLPDSRNCNSVAIVNLNCAVIGSVQYGLILHGPDCEAGIQILCCRLHGYAHNLL